MDEEPRPPRPAVVVDVNVLFSGFITTSGSPPRQIIEMWLGGVIDIVVSPKLLDEAADVFARPRLEKYVQGRGPAWIALLQAAGLHYADPSDSRWTIREDPDDEYLVALAVAANVALVTGDPDLPTVEPPPPIRILTARDFVSMIDDWLQKLASDSDS